MLWPPFGFLKLSLKKMPRNENRTLCAALFPPSSAWSTFRSASETTGSNPIKPFVLVHVRHHRKQPLHKFSLITKFSCPFGLLNPWIDSSLYSIPNSKLSHHALCTIWSVTWKVPCVLSLFSEYFQNVAIYGDRSLFIISPENRTLLQISTEIHHLTFEDYSTWITGPPSKNFHKYWNS